MAEMVAIMGETGHGKSHSIQYLNPEETFILIVIRSLFRLRVGKVSIA